MTDGAKILEKDKVLDIFVRELRKALGSRLKKVILYGSRARGDDSSDSDYDILAIVDEVTKDIDALIDEVAGEILYEHSAVFSVIPMNEERFDKDYDPFLMNVHREGIVL